MALDAWLPNGFNMPDGAKARIALFEGADWQIYETQGGGRALVVHDALAARWQEARLISCHLVRTKSEPLASRRS